MPLNIVYSFVPLFGASGAPSASCAILPAHIQSLLFGDISVVLAGSGPDLGPAAHGPWPIWPFTAAYHKIAAHIV